MKKPNHRSHLLASSIICGVFTAVAMPLSVAAISLAMATPAAAQDYSSGVLLGRVADQQGAVVKGASVTVSSVELGFRREFKIGEDGQFRLTSVPAGQYQVTVKADGYRSIDNEVVTVSSSNTSNYRFTLKSDDVAELVVTGERVSRQLNFEASTTGSTVEISELVKQIPLGRSLTDVVKMAPAVVLGGSSADGNFATVPSISGASVAENAYYINGLNVTNFNNYIGASTVPFDFYKTIEVKTGGYSAEFGRATGGVVNSVTKSGSNEFKFAVRGNWEPSDLANTAPDTFRTANHLSESDNRSLTFEAGGPIIKDRLFAFGLVQVRDNEAHGASITGAAYRVDTSKDPFFGLKLDGIITDRQRVEFTFFDTTRETNRKTYSYSNAGGSDAIGSTVVDTTRFELGGQNYVGKYTGELTDWLTVSAAYGVTEDRDNVVPGLASEPLVNDIRSGTSRRLSRQSAATNDFPVETRREFFRGDVDVYFDLVGQHHIRAGYDEEKLTLDHTTTRTGGVSYTYRRGSASDRRGVPAGRDYVDLTYFSTGGKFEGTNKALYIQDSWSPTDRLTLNLGLRRDQFSNQNAAGETFVEFNNEIAPRVGVTYDLFGDRMTKLYANYGRYFLPVASNTAYRQGAAELNFREFYNAPAGGFVIDPTTGKPAALGSLITQATNPTFTTASPCPAGGLVAAGTDACVVTSDGSVLPTESSISKNLKSTYEDEFIVGIEHRLNTSWRVGAAIHARKLGRASEDVAVDAAVLSYCAAQKITGCDAKWDGFHQYTIVNPGFASTIVLRDPINGESTVRTISLTPEQMKYPKASREYLGLELTMDRAFDGKWGLQGSYTLSRSKGNYEGFVKSDVGQDDAGITQDFDQPGLVDGASGHLPNERKHVFKAQGSYAVTKDLLIGANLLVQSPKKYGCIGVHPTDEFAQVYGAASWFCQGKSTPRGSQFESDWIKNVDVSLRYTVPDRFMKLDGSLVLRADIFNIFDTQGVTEAYEFGDLDSGDVDPNYKKPTGYQAPRYVRLGFDLEF
jgi:outer membrane receptor protein involved in Fe transport